MTAAARKVNGAARPSALAVFTARCEARALLWKDGELDLHQAVDELWASAVRDGLVGELGTDKVQSLLADAFAPMRDDLLELQEIEAEPEDTADYDGSTFAQACRAADERLLTSRKMASTGAAPRAAECTIEALMLALRERGTAALAKPDTRRRLADLSSAQVREVLARLMALRSSYPAINDELLFLLGEKL